MRCRVIFFILLALASSIAAFSAVHAQETPTEPVVVHVFERDDCSYCKELREYLAGVDAEKHNLTVQWHDVVNNTSANALYQRITLLKRVPRITPIVVIGDTLIQGFDAPETTGARILDTVARAQAHERITLEEFIANTETTVTGEEEAGCESGDVCLPTAGGHTTDEFAFTLPFVGVVNLQTFSLTTLAVVLGAVDGFNPCAMWVLITFLIILLQIGNRRKMWQVAGLFILAEAVMYWLILNVWYTTWDFVGLDQIVTPFVGVVAVAGGLYFLYKYYKSRRALVCDVANLETQSRFQKRIQHIASTPLTFAAIGGIIAIAFSVNVIEFACSVGIPQAFTKILELNQLTFFETQWYTFLYILFYMFDDFVVFGLALWGSHKIHATEKYSRASLLIGGVLMLILGILLIAAPDILAF